MNEQLPLVSVLTPVYNGEAFIADCIESVLAQTYSNFEYLIVNNCSTDDTLEIANRYAAKDARIQVRTNETFVGVIENHNRAFRLMPSTASYCKVVSADDFLFPDCIQKMVTFAEANPSVGFVGAYQLCGSVVKWQGFTYPQQVFEGRELCRRVLMQEQIFVGNQPILGIGSPTSLLYRADLVRDSDAFYPNPSPHSDTSACLRDLDRCDFGFVYQVLSFELSHQASQTSTSTEMNRHASASLHDMLEYGPRYLEKVELDAAIASLLRNYRRFLAGNVGRSRGDAFWSYHRQRLQELGFPLTKRQLAVAFLRRSIERIVNPGRAASEVLERLEQRS